MISKDFLLGYGAGKAAGGGGGGGSSPLPAGFSGVAFIDYDGTVLHTYTPEEFSALSDLPANPTHEGLTAQGWNWTKAQIAAQLTAVPGGPVIVGQMYITDDGKTRVYISLEEGRLSPYLGLVINGSVDIDWGDGSTHDTATGSGRNTIINTQHTYAAAGDYVIKLTVTGSAKISGSNGGSALLWKNITSSAFELPANRCYQNAVKRVEIGGNVSVDISAFYNCFSLSSITIPSGVVGIYGNAFSGCYSLLSITIPSGITSIGSGSFTNCSALSAIAIPSGVTSIGSSAFYACYSLSSITIPSGVTSLSSNMFSNCYSLSSITIPSGVTVIDASVFSSCRALSSITIPSRVTSIGKQAFYSCQSLSSITIPSSVTSIGSQAFYSCSCAGFIRFKGSTPPTVDSDAWTNILNDYIIYVPYSADHSVLNAYETADNYPDPNTHTYVEE